MAQTPLTKFQTLQLFWIKGQVSWDQKPNHDHEEKEVQCQISTGKPFLDWFSCPLFFKNYFGARSGIMLESSSFNLYKDFFLVDFFFIFIVFEGVLIRISNVCLVDTSGKDFLSQFQARIKKIMQTDEEVGKVAQPVPVIISRALELFVENLLKKANDITSQRGARTLTPSHL